MPSQRRVKAFGLLIFLTVLITFYWTSAVRQTRSSEFYTRTSAALQNKEDAAALAERRAQEVIAHARDEDDIAARLKAAEEKAKQATDEKENRRLQQVLSENEDKTDDSATRSVAGRVKIKDDKEGDTPGVARVGGNGENMEKLSEEPKTDEETEVELELNSILKKGPIIIFSKSYCPYSKLAKHILLDLYKITPSPYVVELDEHRLGSGLQASLGKMTNRRTVPNILINGMSIGGGDDIKALHHSGKIAETITSMAGKRVTEVKLLPIEDAEESNKDGLRRKRSAQ